MPLITRLPGALEDAEAILKRRASAEKRKNMWRSTYQDAYRFAMPTRETFSWQTEGQQKSNVLFDSTLQEATYTAANTLCALLFPSWARWVELTAGSGIPTDEVPPDVVEGFQQATEIFFHYLNHSNFPQVVNETALDLMVGTGSLSFDQGDIENPFVFTSIPLSSIELEEGPNGTIETTFMCRKPLLRNLLRMYQGMEPIDLPPTLVDKILKTPEIEVEIIQAEIYDPETKHYYGVVVWSEGRQILWRFDFGTTCPTIVARATKVAGELYGRGRVLLALPDAKTLDKMQEFVLRHGALQVAGAFTGISDGVLNPYTAVIQPNVIIPVASNDSGNPSLAPIEFGGNFQITEAMMTDLRTRVRRTMLGPEPSEGSVRSATEVGVNDRNRLWAMNGEFGRIQAELLTKVVMRGVAILQEFKLMPQFKINGKAASMKYTSPFAKSQAMEDVQAFQTAISIVAPLGPTIVAQGFKIEDVPNWVGAKLGVPQKLLRSDEEKATLGQQVAQASAANPEGTAAAVGMVTGGAGP